MYGNAVLGSNILQLVHELRVGEVVHLASPQPCHPREVEVFDADSVISTAKVVGELPLKIGTLVAYVAVYAVKLLISALSVVAALLGFRQSARSLSEFAEVCFEELRIGYTRAIGEGHICLQPKIHAHGCTFECLSVGLCGTVENHNDKPIADGIAFYDEPLDSALVRTREEEAESFANLVYCQLIAFELVTALLEHYGGKELRGAELRRSLGNMVEETLIGYVKTFYDLLDGLRVEALHPITLGKMTFEAIDADVFAKEPIIAFLQGKAMIPYKARFSEHSREILVALGVIELVLVRNHTTNILKMSELIKCLTTKKSRGRFHPTTEVVGFHAPGS